MRSATILALLLVLLAAVPARAEDDDPDARADCVGTYCSSDAIYQFGPSAAFAASLFDGPTSFRDVLRVGDFGLGATSPLEGEVIILDGTAYHASPTGEVDILEPGERTPFAVVKHFRADRRVDLPAIGSFDDLAHALDAALPSRNLFYAARIDGHLDEVVLRSVARQSPPYPPLAEVVKSQNVFTASSVDGTLVGFRFPAYVEGVNAGGWHFHFVDEARHIGGHVLDVRAGPLTAALDESRSLTLVLPDDPAFDAADLTHGAASADAFQSAVRPGSPPRATPGGESSPGATAAREVPAPSDAPAVERDAPEPQDAPDAAATPGAAAPEPERVLRDEPL